MERVNHWARNKILIIQWRLRKIIGRKLARYIAITLEHLFLH
jgi:hypothetical protein